jgi:lipoprotein-anchoring transpeptidase ErfK/SrfK
VARVLHPVRARRAPRLAPPRGKLISTAAPYDGGPQTLLVLLAHSSVRDGVFYRVLLPDRPNGSSAWIPASAVRVRSTRLRVRVSLGSRRLELLAGGRVARRWTVAVGTTTNPTPRGVFAISEIVPQTPSNGFFGTFIITLTAHSARLSEFDGGDGRVALHGTNLPGLLGQAVSHGCVRLPNDAATYLGRILPLGTPVEVR